MPTYFFKCFIAVHIWHHQVAHDQTHARFVAAQFLGIDAGYRFRFRKSVQCVSFYLCQIRTIGRQMPHHARYPLQVVVGVQRNEKNISTGSPGRRSRTAPVAPGGARAYVCRNYTCGLPVSTAYTITSAIIGPRTPAQLEDALAASDVRLDPDVLDEIDDVVRPGTDVAGIRHMTGNPYAARSRAELRRRPRKSEWE